MSRDRAAALIVSLAPVLYFLPAVWGGSVLCPDDGTIFNTPLRVAAANITLDGNLPLWNPYIFSGMPLLGSAQGGLLFPLNWFYLAFPAQAATNLMVIASYVVAALGAYLYARRAGASVAGSVVTSLAWQWGGFLIGQIGHINIVQTAACLPWVLWALDGYALKGRRRWGVLLAMFVALQTFAGHQQTLAYSLLLASAYAVASAYSEKEPRARYLWSLAFLAAGVMLAAVQILPTFELLRNSPRADATYDFFTSFSMTPRMIETFIAPYVAGGGDGALFRAPYVGPPYYGEMAGYVGALGLMLAACAVIFKRDSRTKFWAAAALVCLTLALGRYAPLRFYKLIYHVPILNLFRVPARHLMETQFALAVLAGRGLTALSASRMQSRAVRRALIVGVFIMVLTCIVVTLGRPGAFKLAREAPVGVLRAPELFVPVIVACASAWALWAFARRGRGASVMLVAVLACDLALWGQSSGWRLSSPKSDEELWREPETVKLLHAHGAVDPSSYRILTAPHAFDPAVAPVPPSVSHSTEWTLWTQPDVYMMSDIHNAAGYDGFGLARYSRLAGEMKVWGELTNPDASLRGESREIDLLGVRYLLSMHTKGSGAKVAVTGTTNTGGGITDAAKMKEAAVPTPEPLSTPTPAQDFPAATQEYGGFMFAASDLGLPNIGVGKSLRFTLAPTAADRIALVTNLSWSEDVPDGAIVGRVRLRVEDGRVFEFALRAGADTSEWAHDRADIRARIRHRRAGIATSYAVADASGSYEGHTYVTSFALPERVAVTGGEIAAEASSKWPDLLLGVFRVSLVDTAEGHAYPLRREWVSVERSGRVEVATTPKAAATPAPKAAATPSAPKAQPDSTNLKASGEDIEKGGAGDARWHLLGQTAQADIYENARALPRVWLANEARVLGEDATLEVIRKGRLPEGSRWEPLHTALVESEPAAVLAPGSGASGRAEVTRYEPNRVDVRTNADAPSILVLSENHYPGWRAYLDGRSVGVLRVDYGLRGVNVPAGEHEVSFVYRPKSVLVGLLISLLTAAVLLLWWRRLLPEGRMLRLAARLRRTRHQSDVGSDEVSV
ncbi:MAG: hypothetical protein QOE46_2155 [Acidobacteriota bacterium]|nr:hypothetical protein [Acidobacteriota bacterium]